MTLLSGADIEGFVLLMAAASVAAAGVEFLRGAGPPAPSADPGVRPKPIGFLPVERASVAAAFLLLAGMAAVVVLRSPTSLGLLAEGVVIGGLAGLGLGAFSRTVDAVAADRIHRNPDPVWSPRREAPLRAATLAKGFGLAGTLLLTLVLEYVAFAGDLRPLVGAVGGLAAVAIAFRRVPATGFSRSAGPPIDLLTGSAVAATAAMVIALTDSLVRDLLPNALLYPLTLLALAPAVAVGAGAVDRYARARLRVTGAPRSPTGFLGAAAVAVVGSGVLNFLELGWSSSLFLAAVLGIVAGAFLAMLPHLRTETVDRGGATDGAVHPSSFRAGRVALSIGAPSLALGLAYLVGGWPDGPGAGIFNVSFALYAVSLASVGYLLLAAAWVIWSAPDPSTDAARDRTDLGPSGPPASTRALGPGAYGLGATVIALGATLGVGPGLLAGIRATDVDTQTLLTLPLLAGACAGFALTVAGMLALRRLAGAFDGRAGAPGGTGTFTWPVFRTLCIGGLGSLLGAGSILILGPGGFLGVVVGAVVGVGTTIALAPVPRPSESGSFTWQPGPGSPPDPLGSASSGLPPLALWVGAVAFVTLVAVATLSVASITYWSP